MPRRSPLASALLGVAVGFTVAYTIQRALDARADRRRPVPTRTPDPQSYGATRRRLMLTGIARSLASSAVWTFLRADPLERRLSVLPRPLRLPTYAALVVLVESAREWPIDYIEAYVLERVYATSERTARAWATERTKGLALALATTLVLATLADQMIHRAPRRWPWIAIVAMPALLAAANVLVPTFVMPLFNTYAPLEGELAHKIRGLARRYGVGHATLLRFDMSRQTKKANAFVTGVFGTQRIVLADTLIEAFPEDETLFVVAHELGHYVRRDPWAGIALGTLLTAVTLLGARAFARHSLGREPAGIGGLARVGFYASLGQLAAGPIGAAFSRSIERRADRFALAATDAPLAGARAFRRLREHNLAEDEAPRWAELLFATHPSLKSRIAMLEAAALSR